MPEPAATHEFVTEVLDEPSSAKVLAAIVAFLRDRGCETVTAEYGFRLERDQRGESPPENRTVPLRELEALIHSGLRDGTIDWGGDSDFFFAPLGLPVQFMLCNDGDLHFASPDRKLLLSLSRRISRSGVRVYESGDLVPADFHPQRSSTTGWTGMGLLLLAWLLPRDARPLFLLLALVASLVSLGLGLLSARKGSRWWYLLAAVSLLSTLVLSADWVAGG